MSHTVRHVPDKDQYRDKKEKGHACSPGDRLERHSKDITVEDRSIVECDECGQLWYSRVYSKDTSYGYGGRTYYHLDWYKLRWYHFRLKKYTR